MKSSASPSTDTGYIKLYRKILDNPLVCKDAEHFAVWSYLLLSATHKERTAMFQGKVVTLLPGQLITGRKSIAEKFNISESKVQRIINCFEIEHQIERQTSNKSSLISILNWESYQSSEHQTEQQLNNNRTTTEQQLNTNNNVKNVENDKNDNNEDTLCRETRPNIYSEVISYLNEKAGTSYKPSTKSTQAHIKARQAEGFTLDDFKKVIDSKTAEWKSDAKMSQYLRPETLFGTKFESYLNGGVNGRSETAEELNAKYGNLGRYV